MKKIPQTITTFIILIISWYGAIKLFSLPDYILPTPMQVAMIIDTQFSLLMHHALITLLETVAGLLLGSCFGIMAAIFIALFNPARKWFLPILIGSQAVPVFALAPIIVLWFGYGITSKLIITMLMVFFPITSSLYDGLTRINPEWINLAKTMQATKLRMLRYIHLPASLPSLAQGLKIAAVSAPIGAIIGEWVGGSQGLGYLMLSANSQMRIDLMFAALIILVSISLGLYFITTNSMSMLISWQPKTSL